MMTSDVTEDTDESSDVVTEEGEVTETVEDIADVTEEETYDMPEVIDEELATEKVEDISDFIEDESTMMTSDVTEDTDETSDVVTEEGEFTENS